MWHSSTKRAIKYTGSLAQNFARTFSKSNSCCHNVTAVRPNSNTQSIDRTIIYHRAHCVNKCTSTIYSTSVRRLSTKCLHPVGTQNLYARCLTTSCRRRGDQDVSQDPDDNWSDADESVTAHEQTSQAVIHYGRGGIASIEDLLFHILSNEDGMLSVGKFLEALAHKGLRTSDPRLKESMDNFRHKFSRRFPDGLHDCMLDQESFRECISDNVVLIGRALQNKFIIPDFEDFTPHIEEKYHAALNNTSGQVASYIPQLARQNPDHWGVAICTVDGQRFSIGNTNVPFSLQSTSKTMMYTLALTLHGPEYVHQYVGFEPSGRPFNDLCLNPNNKPHNPMLNSGAMVTCALIQPDMCTADRFDYIISKFKEMAGGELVSFCNATFLSEKGTGFRNYAMGYLMEEYRCFPPGHTTMETTELYFQVCSMQATCDSGAVIASTLANGGICPITGQKVFEPFAVRDSLTLMSSCGMYDYSGQFAFMVGMPAKSGVSGAIMVVIPNVMGMMLFSPPLDKYGNSVRGMQFCKDLVSTFNFHNYDDLHHVAKKLDPRRVRWENRATQMINLLFAAYNGDVSAMRQYYLQGTDMSSSDYDARTPLHLAAAEGHKEVVLFLLEKCNVSPVPQDRWGRTPLDEAQTFGHTAVEEILIEFMRNKQTVRRDEEQVISE